MVNSKLKGLGVAMVTPFKSDTSIDWDALKKLTNFLIDGGVDYLVVQGTTGESPTISKDEKQKILDTVVTENAGRLPVVFGIGGNATANVINDLKTYNLKGVDAILSASPYYNKPTQEGIYQHYKNLAENSELPIILYNVPGRTSSNITAATTHRLANDFENIVAVKEASGDMEQIMQIIQNRPENFLVISGDDAITWPIIAAGGDGVISVVGNGFPAEFKTVVEEGLKGNMKTANTAHYKLLPIIPLLFAEGNPGGIKEVLAERNIMGTTMRLPLVNVSDGLKDALIQATNKILK
ncbi:MAG: 4-hydroxy-tetrahydrodipicolinate synthase [Crocinitomicaceae bacterium]